MIEYRTERVAPQAENDVTEILATFGWVQVSAQEVYNESTEITGVDVKMYGDGLVGSFMQGFTGKDGMINVRQRKNVTNYVTLRFARNTEMPEYERLKKLNEEFEYNLNVPEPKKPVARTAIMVVGTLLIIISVILAIVQSNSAAVWEIIVCVAFPMVMIPITVVGWVKYKRKLNRYNYVQARLYQVYSEAREIIS